MDQLQHMLQFIRKEIENAGFISGMEAMVELAFEEAIVNIIKHGYANSIGNIEINSTHLPQKGIKLELIDTGIPYNPLLNIAKKKQKTLKETEQPGGYGIHLILNIMDDVQYEYKHGCNILSLIKLCN